MAKVIFNEGDRKTDFYFTNNDRSLLEGIVCGDLLSLPLRDERGEAVTISFTVTRNAFLGSFCRRIYGKVLDQEDPLYRQIEIRLYQNDPTMDTVAVFPTAPPVE